MLGYVIFLLKYFILKMITFNYFDSVGQLVELLILIFLKNQLKNGGLILFKDIMIIYLSMVFGLI
jgi:hypothetical protein